MKRLLLAAMLVAGFSLCANTADAQRHYARGHYGPAYYNTYRPYYGGYGPTYYNTFRPNYYGSYQPYYYFQPYRAYRGPLYYVPNRAWGAAPGRFYGGGLYSY